MNKKESTTEQVLDLVKELDLDDVDALAALLGSIAEMYRYKGFDWSFTLFNIMRRASKTTKGIHEIELVEGQSND